MSKEEKLLLLELIMRDVRREFPESRKDKRVLKIIELSKDLGLEKLHEETKDWLNNSDYLDGRHFRDCHTNYDKIRKMHSLKPTYRDKSDTFKKEAYHNIKYLQYAFEEGEQLLSEVDDGNN